MFRCIVQTTDVANHNLDSLARIDQGHLNETFYHIFKFVIINLRSLGETPTL